MGLKQIFQKQGGMKLLKRYWKSGALFTAVGEFLLLGKERTALELLRLSAELKTKQKLERKYKKYLVEFDRAYDADLPHEADNKVWVCWFQGMEKAPEIVKKCYSSIQKNIKDKEIVLITYENMYDYVQFPSYIQEKIDSGIISGAHLSDLLRLQLLNTYGGTWIDATVLCTSSEIPDYMLNSELFMFQTLKPGRDGHATVISNWFITSCRHNKMLEALAYLLFKYWEKNNEVLDYFIFHDMFQMVLEFYPQEWNGVVPFSSSTPHILALRLFEKYDDTCWNAVLKMSPFHKLSYKFDANETLLEDTYYKKIMSI